MDSLSDVSPARLSFNPSQARSEATSTSSGTGKRGLDLRGYKERRKEIDLQLVSSATRGPRDSDAVSVGFEDLYKGLSITAKRIVDEINSLLKAKLPNGVQSLDPSEVTPEATAERIVSGSTAFFHIFAKQNPGLEGEELIDKFMKTIRSGIERGYGEAFEILKGLGAFDIDGIQAGVEETKRLIDEKLAAYEADMRRQLGLTGGVEESAGELAQSEVLASAGRGVDVRA